LAELGYTNSGQNSPRTVIVIGGTGYLGAAVVAHLTMAGANAIPVRHSSLDDHPQDMFYLNAIPASTSGPSDSQRWDFTVIDLSSGARQEASALEPDWHAVSRLVARRMETLKVLADSGMSHLVFVSSGGALFPYSNRQPVGEDGEARPHSTYGILKLAHEDAFADFARASEIPLTVLRPANIFGGDEHRRRHKSLVGLLVANALTGGITPIWGMGGVRRDYIHVQDVAAAIDLAVESPCISGIFHLGTGVPTESRELVEIARSILAEWGLSCRVRWTTSDSREGAAAALSSTLISQSLGWQPRWSLREGILDAVRMAQVRAAGVVGSSEVVN
jgi:UDP-glucose 4-epimerase